MRKNKVSHFLSYVLPCYNYADVIEEALGSIYQQQLKIPFEVICTDDYSTDQRTREILRSWEQKYDNFHAYFHDKNEGPSAAANTCVKHSKGDLIFYLDTDNILPAGLVQRMVEHFDKTDCAGVCPEKMIFFTGSNREINKTGKVTVHTAPNNLIDLQATCRERATCGSSGNYLYTRESYDLAGGYPENHNIMSGWGLGFRQGATGSNMAILPDSFYWHRYSPEGVYMAALKKGSLIQDNRLVIIKEFLDLFEEETVKLLLSEDWGKLIKTKKIKVKKLCYNKKKNKS